jgi:hypothetical protein
MTQQTTPRLGLPLLAAGQAQKEVTHNEALMLIDALGVATSQAVPQNQPLTAPVVGQCWLVGPIPVGSWSGQAHALASWTIGGWRFVTMPSGARVILAENGACWRRISGGWQGPQAVGAPTGGLTIDGEARSAISLMIVALTNAGLLSSP